MGEVQWIKFYIDMFDKRKIKKLRRLPAGNDLLLIWVMLLAMAGKCNAGGHIYITPTVPFQEDDLADELDFDVNTIRLALQAFSELGMISLSDNGFIYISNWEKYQSADKLAELRAKDRERKRLKRAEAKALLDVSEDVRGQSAERPLIEEDKEVEEDEEKEFHSFNHSYAHEENILENLQNNRDEAALEEYVADQVAKAGFDDPKYDAIYEEEVRESLRRKYWGGEIGQNVVLMSNAQFSDLCDRLSIDELDKYMAIVAECELSGKKYKKKTHYQAILDMAAKDRRIKK